MKKTVQLILGCSISIVMLYLVFKDLEFAKLSENVSKMEWWPLIPFLIFFCIHYYFRSLRWRYLLPPPQHGKGPGLRQLFDSMILGNLATFLLPFRVGEFVRPLVLSRWSEYSFASAFISVVIERFFDLSAVLISFAIIIPSLRALPGAQLPEMATVGAWSLGGLAFCLLMFLVLGCLFPKFIRSVVTMCVAPLPAALGTFVTKFSSDLLDGAAVIKTPARLLAIIVLTVILWLTAFLQFYALLFLFPNEPQSFLLSVTLGVFVALAIAVPSAPGFVGVFHAGCVAATALFAYSDAGAQVYAIIVHLITFLLFTGIGFWLLSVHDLNLFELKKAAEQDS